MHFPKEAEKYLAIWIKGLTDIKGNIHISKSLYENPNEDILVHVLLHELGHIFDVEI
jgi:Zn-dependent protease with chaperone function